MKQRKEERHGERIAKHFWFLLKGKEEVDAKGWNLQISKGQTDKFSFCFSLMEESQKMWERAAAVSAKQSRMLFLQTLQYDSLKSVILFLQVIGNNSKKAMAPHSSTLAWKIPWTEEPGRLQSMGSLRVGHDWGTSLSLVSFMHWRRKWQPTPVFLPGESQGRRSLVGCRLWGRT